MTDHTGLGGGLRELHANLLDGYQPFSTAIVAILAHNQQLIQDTLVPRHLVNDYYPRVQDGFAPVLMEDGYGTPVAMWGRWKHQPGYELSIKVNAARVEDYISNTDIYFFSTPTLPDLNGYLPGMLDAQDGYLHMTVSAPEGEWLDGYMNPDPGQGNWHYLSLWARPTDLVASYIDLRCVCVRERRKRE